MTIGNLMVRMLLSGSKPGSFNKEDIEHYRQAWWRKGRYHQHAQLVSRCHSDASRYER